MPLIAVTFDYLIACKCGISFLPTGELPKNFLEVKPKTCGLLAAECSHPDYPEEGAAFFAFGDYPTEGAFFEFENEGDSSH